MTTATGTSAPTRATLPRAPQAVAAAARGRAADAAPDSGAGAALLRAADVERMVVRCRAALRGRGVRAGDRVALVAGNSQEFVAALLALVALDTSIVLCDEQQTPEQIRRTLERSRARWVLGDADVRAACRGALGPGDDPAEPVRFDRWRERRDGLVLWSSGSTGRPKGIVRSGAAMLVNTEATQRAMRYRPDDVLLPLLPFSHQYGMSLVLLWWQVRCSLLVAPYKRLSAVAASIARYGVTVVDAAPPTYHALLQLFERKPGLLAAAGSVRMWCVGGAPLPAPLAERFRGTVGLPLLDGYGLSELGNVALAVPEHPEGCGRPLDGVRLRIDAPRDGVGEVLVRSPGLMTGYLPDDGGDRDRDDGGDGGRDDGSSGADAGGRDGNAGSDGPGDSREITDDDGWFRTGDLGTIAADGTLRVIGRRQAVHRMGYTLYPESLRRQAEACGRPVAVVAVEDERLGCRLVFFVEDADRRDARYWRPRLDRLLAAYERPNLVEVVERLPLTRTGKVDRAQLTTTAAERLAARHADGERP